jgi:hypothetical protein
MAPAAEKHKGSEDGQPTPTQNIVGQGIVGAGPDNRSGQKQTRPSQETENSFHPKSSRAKALRRQQHTRQGVDEATKVDESHEAAEQEASHLIAPLREEIR